MLVTLLAALLGSHLILVALGGFTVNSVPVYNNPVDKSTLDDDNIVILLFYFDARRTASVSHSTPSARPSPDTAQHAIMVQGLPLKVSNPSSVVHYIEWSI